MEEKVEHTIMCTWCYISSRKQFNVPYKSSESLSTINRRSISELSAVLRQRLESEVVRIDDQKIMVKRNIHRTATSAARAIFILVHGRWICTRKAQWIDKEMASRILKVNPKDGLPLLSHRNSFLRSMKGCLSTEALRNVWQHKKLP